jgi:RNA polymerase sigma-70 factor (ECF subfamily)
MNRIRQIQQTKPVQEGRRAHAALPERDEQPAESPELSRERRFVDRLKNRDQEAVRELVRHYHDRLSAVANRICNNPADAEEVLQDVYMTALNKIDRFEERSALSTWLYRITVNTALMKLRRQRVVQKNTVPMEEGGGGVRELEKEGLSGERVRSPDDVFLGGELFEQVRESVESLPDNYRSVFVLRGIQGLSIRETSKILKVTPGAIKSRLHRSRHLIQERLNPYLE